MRMPLVLLSAIADPLPCFDRSALVDPHLCVTWSREFAPTCLPSWSPLQVKVLDGGFPEGETDFGHGPSKGGCAVVDGTSTATPVAVGVAALIASTIPEEERYRKVTPAALKQWIVEGSDRVEAYSMYDQGAGVINLKRSFEVARTYEPRVTAFPPYLDLASEEDLEYFWPHSMQPMYAKAMPLMVNFTIASLFSR